MLAQHAVADGPIFARIRVLVVDDHAMIRELFCSLIAAEPDMELVGVAADGQEALAQARRLNPHVVLMDVTMPGVDGISATRTLSHEMPDVRVIALSIHAPEFMAEPMLAAGAVGYFLKDGPKEDLLRAIRDAAQQRAPVQPTVHA
jgi:DNA-binding NarL/FixJ family response regulator